MNTQDKNQEIAHSSAYNPFPEPRTIPSGWDLSEFLSASESLDLAQDRPAPVTEADDPAES
jgi:hypothetical protein